MNIPSFEEQQRVLHSPFDIDTHRATFINYLEIILLPDGTPEYAVPSHLIKLAHIYGKSMDEIYEEYAEAKTGLDGIGYLCSKTGCVAVWSDRVQGTPNNAQTATLKRLEDAGVFRNREYDISGDSVDSLPWCGSATE